MPSERTDADARWVSMSRSSGLQIHASGPNIDVTQLPPGEGTVLRRGGNLQEEEALFGWHPQWLPGAAATERRDSLGEQPVSQVPLREKVEFVRALQAKLTGRDPRIVQTDVLYREVTEQRRIATDRFDRESRLSRVLLFAVAVVHDGGRTDMNRLVRAGSGGFEVVSGVSDAELDAMVEEAVRVLGAESIEPGSYRVVTHPEVSGVIAHEAFGHGVEMDLFLSGRARAGRYMGTRVGSDLVTIVDDPTVEGGYGSYPFDDDGTPAAPHDIVSGGILTQGLSDAEVASALGASGGNGRRQDYTRKVYPRMSNTFFRPGGVSVEELIRGVDRGVYLRQVSSGMEDPLNWGMQVICHHGEEIRDGALTGRLYRTMPVTGYVPEVLSSVDGVAGDFELTPGTCGKGWKEWVPVTSGGPHLRMTVRLG